MVEQEKNIIEPKNGIEKSSPYDVLMKDIVSIEEVLLPQLNELAEKIDSSFSDISLTIRLCAEGLLSTNMFSAKNKTKIAAGATVTSAIIDSIGTGYSAYKHNKYLDAILVEKKKIANTKISVIEKVIPLTKKAFENASQLVLQNVDKNYTSDLLKNKETLELILSNAQKEVNILRTSCYYMLMVQYLYEEYNAWISGLQVSKLDRPSLYTANTQIFLKIICAKCLKKKMEGFLSNNSDYLKGCEVYILADKQLTNTYLIFMGNNRKFIDPNEDCEYLPPELPINFDNKNAALSVIKKSLMVSINDADKKTFNDLYDIGDGTIKTHLIYGLLCVGVIVLLVFLDWALWLRIILGFIVEIVLIYMWGSKVGSQKESFYGRLINIQHGVYARLLKEAGYVKYDKSVYQKKNVLEEAVGGLFKNF